MEIALIAAVFTITPAVNAGNSANAHGPISWPMVVYKSPNCGCCGSWVKHIEAAGFSTKIEHPKDLNMIKDQLSVAPIYQACHTATLKGYVFEGHIPANVIEYFIAKNSAAAGLAVPNMPMGSPGMDINANFRPYQVVQLNKDGSSTPYAKVSANKTIYWDKK